MSTRGDFYIGLGQQAEWLGSLAHGYPCTVVERLILDSHTADEWRANVTALVGAREDGSTPADGWPWPWNNSGLTDYAYTWSEGRVQASCFGAPFFDPLGPEPGLIGESQPMDEDSGYWPDMKARANVQMFGPRSGILLVGFPKP